MNNHLRSKQHYTPSIRLSQTSSETSFFKAKSRLKSKSPMQTTQDHTPPKDFDQYFHLHLEKVHSEFISPLNSDKKQPLKIDTSPKYQNKARLNTSTSKYQSQKKIPQQVNVSPQRPSVDDIQIELLTAKDKIAQLERNIEEIYSQKGIMQREFNEKLELAYQVNECLKQKIDDHGKGSAKFNYFAPQDQKDFEILKNNKQVLQEILNDAKQYSQQISERQLLMEHQDILLQVKRLFPTIQMNQIPNHIQRLQQIQQESQVNPQAQPDLTNLTQNDDVKTKYSRLKNYSKALTSDIKTFINLIRYVPLKAEEQLQKLLQNHYNQLSSHIDLPQTNLDFFTGTITTQVSDIEIFKQQIKQNEELIQMLRKQNLVQSEELRVFNNRAQEQMNQLTQLEQKIRQQNQTINELEQNLRDRQNNQTQNISNSDTNSGSEIKFYETLNSQLKTEVENLQTEKYKLLEKITQMERQFKELEESYKLSKDDIKSQSSKSDDSIDEDLEEENRQMKEQLIKLKSDLEQLQIQNQELKKKLRDVPQRQRQSTQVRNSKSFWDMEIVGSNNSLLSLVNDKWIFTFRNTEDDWLPYTDQIAIFSFETHTIQKFIDITFNYVEWRSEIYQSLARRDTCYFKLHQHNNTHHLILAKLLNYFPVQSFQQVSNTTRDEIYLNEFWLKYALSQNGVLIFTCSKLNLEEIQFINYLKYLFQKVDSKCKVVVCLLRNQPKDSDLSNKIQYIGIPECSIENPVQTNLQMWHANNFSKVNIALETLLGKSASKFNMVEQLRSYMLQQHNEFFISQTTEPFFDMVQMENSFYLTLRISPSKEGKHKLQQKRQYQYFIDPFIQQSLVINEKSIQLGINIPEFELIKLKVFPTNQAIFIKMKVELKKVEMDLYFEQYLPGQFQLEYENFERVLSELRIHLKRV